MATLSDVAAQLVEQAGSYPSADGLQNDLDGLIGSAQSMAQQIAETNSAIGETMSGGGSEITALGQQAAAMLMNDFVAVVQTAISTADSINAMIEQARLAAQGAAAAMTGSR